MSDLVVVDKFLKRHEAEMAKGLLEAEGINCIIITDDCGGENPGMNFGKAITLSVQKTDAAKAKKILAER